MVYRGVYVVLVLRGIDVLIKVCGCCDGCGGDVSTVVGWVVDICWCVDIRL